ncbi:MAG: penicillin-binding transpeptidase domain-containing protein, partial [Chloroflexota bacterium]
TLLNLQTGMRMVTNNSRGTAYRIFANQTIPVFGKTGTASVGNENVDPHAWFIGYTNTGRTDKPDIAIAVIVENVGDGSEFAAPMFRRVMETYFFGKPQSRYPWETQIGVLNPKYFLSEEELLILEELEGNLENEGEGGN